MDLSFFLTFYRIFMKMTEDCTTLVEGVASVPFSKRCAMCLKNNVDGLDFKFV